MIDEVAGNRLLHFIVNCAFVRGQKTHARYLKESLTGMTQVQRGEMLSNVRGRRRQCEEDRGSREHNE